MPQKVTEDAVHKSKKSKKTSSTRKVSHHAPISIAFQVSSSVEGYSRPVECLFGEDCIDRFMDALHDIYDKSQPILTPSTPMKLPDDETMAELEAAVNCHICGRLMDQTDKHLDHDHQTGEVLGYAHPLCNLERQQQNYVPVVFHNLKG